MGAGPWVKSMIAGVVACTALCAVFLFAGCASGALKAEQCNNSQETALGVLTGLLTTVMGLAVKLDALDPKARTPQQRVTPKD